MSWFEREMDPSLPPWLSVRAWMAVVSIILGVVALVMSL